MCKSLDPNPRDSVSGGFEWHLKTGICTKWPGDAGWLGAHSENHCCVHQDFSKDWYSRKMLHASPVASRHLFLHRTLQGLHTGPVWETHEFRGPEQPLEGQVADAFLYPQGFAGRGGEMSRSGL